jgi:hypothetical protein
MQLLELGGSTRKRKWSVSRLESGLFSIHLDLVVPKDQGEAAGRKSAKEVTKQVDIRASTHIRVYRGCRQLCRGCQYSGTSRVPNKKRRVLGELSQNTRHYYKARQSLYGCQACNVALCKDGDCFVLYHDHNSP